MRFAVGLASSAVVLAAAGSTGLLGSWSLGVAAMIMLVAGVTGAIALESRDLATARRTGADWRDAGATVRLDRVA